MGDWIDYYEQHADADCERADDISPIEESNPYETEISPKPYMESQPLPLTPYKEASKMEIKTTIDPELMFCVNGILLGYRDGEMTTSHALHLIDAEYKRYDEELKQSQSIVGLKDTGNPAPQQNIQLSLEDYVSQMYNLHHSLHGSSVDKEDVIRDVVTHYTKGVRNIEETARKILATY